MKDVAVLLQSYGGTCKKQNNFLHIYCEMLYEAEEWGLNSTRTPACGLIAVTNSKLNWSIG